MAGKHLGIGTHRDVDLALLNKILAYHDQSLDARAEGAVGGRQAVVLVPVDEGAGALRKRWMDAYISIIVPDPDPAN